MWTRLYDYKWTYKTEYITFLFYYVIFTEYNLNTILVNIDIDYIACCDSIYETGIITPTFDLMEMTYFPMTYFSCIVIAMNKGSTDLWSRLYIWNIPCRIYFVNCLILLCVLLCGGSSFLYLHSNRSISFCCCRQSRVTFHQCYCSILSMIQI